jgi:hypothetical protein
MRLSSIVAAYAGILLGACAAVAQTDEFRIDTDVFVGENKEPIAQSVTVFSSGMVYDFPLIGPREITVFDPGRGRFVLLDADRKVKTTLSTQDLLEFTAAMKVHAEKMGGLLAGASDAQFERETDSAEEWITLRTKMLMYRAKGVEPQIESAAASYQQFADWYARLNATRPGSMPPFLRIELNRMLVEKGLIPEEVELTVAPERGLMGASFAAWRRCRLLPIAASGVLLIGLRWPASRAMPFCYLVARGWPSWCGACRRSSWLRRPSRD